MKRIVYFLVPLLLAASVAFAGVYDKFNRANGGIGAAYTNPLDEPQIVSNVVRAKTLGTGAVGISTGTYAADQTASIVLNTKVATGNTDFGIDLRSDGGGTFYACQAQVAGSTGTQVYKLIGGSYTNIDNTTDTTTVWAAGDVLTCAVEGTRISVYRNSILLIRATDISIASGKPGFFLDTDTSLAAIEVDNFQASSLKQAWADNFQRADGDLSTTYWIQEDPQEVAQIVSNKAEAHSVGATYGSVGAMNDPALFNADSYSQVLLSTFSSANEIHVDADIRETMGGWNGGALSNINFITCSAHAHNATTTTLIYKLVAGSETDVASENATTWTSGDILTHVGYGSTFTCWRNSTLLVTAADTSLTGGGHNGFGIVPFTGANLTDIKLGSAAAGNVISFVGAGAQAVGTTSAATVACAYPTSYTATTNDLGILFVAGLPTDTTDVAAPSGWTARSSSLREVGTNDLKIQTMYRVIQSGDSAPTVTIPASWSGTNGGVSCQMGVWRYVDPGTPFDVADVTGNNAAAATWQPTGVTTVTNFALAVSAVATADDNALNFNTARGFTAHMSGANYDTTTGGDHAVGVAALIMPISGAVTFPTWNESAVGNDAWAGISFALRPLPPPTTRKIKVSH